EAKPANGSSDHAYCYGRMCASKSPRSCPVPEALREHPDEPPGTRSDFAKPVYVAARLRPEGATEKIFGAVDFLPACSPGFPAGFGGDRCARMAPNAPIRDLFGRKPTRADRSTLALCRV